MSQKGKGEERKRQGGKEAQGEEAVYEAAPLVGNMGARAREGELGTISTLAQRPTDGTTRCSCEAETARERAQLHSHHAHLGREN
jgi:hypothetical protein